MNSDDLRRYAAQMRLPEIGAAGQRALAGAEVVVVGCGALGSVAAVYLAGAGVGRLVIADFDTVEISNLHRQPFYVSEDAGQGKVSLLAAHLRRLNPDVEVVAFCGMVSRKSLGEVCSGRTSFVIDAADNPATTYLVDGFCRSEGLPYCTAGVGGWKAQVMSWRPGCVPFSDLFPRPADDAASVLPCSVAGLVGPLSGMVGCIQASEAIKCICGIDPMLTDRLLGIDLLKGDFRTIPV